MEAKEHFWGAQPPGPYLASPQILSISTLGLKIHVIVYEGGYDSSGLGSVGAAWLAGWLQISHNPIIPVTERVAGQPSDPLIELKESVGTV